MRNSPFTNPRLAACRSLTQVNALGSSVVVFLLPQQLLAQPSLFIIWIIFQLLPPLSNSSSSFLATQSLRVPVPGNILQMEDDCNKILILSKSNSCTGPTGTLPPSSNFHLEIQHSAHLKPIQKCCVIYLLFISCVKIST